MLAFFHAESCDTSKKRYKGVLPDSTYTQQWRKTYCEIRHLAGCGLQPGRQDGIDFLW